MLNSIVHRLNSVNHGFHVARLRIVSGRTIEVGPKIRQRLRITPQQKINHGAIVNFLPRSRINGHGHFNHHQHLGKFFAPEI